MLLDRITIDPLIMGGSPCVRGLNVTVNSILKLIANGASPEEIVADYQYLDLDDIRAAVSYSEQTSLGLGTKPEKKPRPNHQRRLRILRSLTHKQKLEQVFKLNERTLMLLRIGLKRRFPDLDNATLQKVYLRMRERCHNKNY